MKVAWLLKVGIMVVLAAGLVGGPGMARAAAPVYSSVYSHPPTTDGKFLHSSRLIGNNNDLDQYAWDEFQLASAASITQVRWRGAYDPAYNGAGGPARYFTMAIYPSIGTAQPDVTGGPLATYQTANNAGETPAGTVNGVAMYDYQFTLPSAFSAAANTLYWMHIEAWQSYPADWAIATGTNGNSRYFRAIANVGDIFYQAVNGADASFSLLAQGSPNLMYLEFVVR